MIPAVIAAVGLGISAYGLISSSKANAQASRLQQQALALQMQEQAERRKAMDLDARRRRREAIRQGIAARSLALTTATAQGAQFGSALPGAYGGIEGRTGTTISGINQNQEIGGNLFDLKSQIAGVQSQIAGAQSSALTGQAVSQFGGMLLQNSTQLAKLSSAASSIFRT